MDIHVKDIHFPSEAKERKKFEKNNTTIAINILVAPYKTKQTRTAFKSKYSNEHENQVILLMITDNKKWHYLSLKDARILDGEKWRPVTSLSRLLGGKTSNHHGDLYCSNCFKCSYSTENRFKEHEELFNKHDYCYPKMPNKYNNLLEYNHGE